jgi:hypothetical protein
MSVQAHEPMQHDCVSPIRPVNDQDNVVWQRFLDDIDRYRSCVSIAQERHEAAGRAHQEAARDAVQSWNDFVRTSLNAPGDFPWPELSEENR